MRVKHQLDSDIFAPGKARGMAASLRGEIDEATIDRLQLVLTELTTNCVLHGDTNGAISIMLESVSPESVRIEVACANSVSQPQSVDPGRLGFGLRLVDLLCADWGVEQQDARTIVWAQIDRGGSTWHAARSTPRSPEP